MIRATTFLCAVAVAASSAIAAQTRSGRSRARAARRRCAGTWDVEMTFRFRPDGPGVPTKGTSTIRPLLGGLFIEEKIDGHAERDALTTLAWTGYNTDSHKYEATRIASTNTDAHRRNWQLRRGGRRNSSSSRPTTRSRATRGTGPGDPAERQPMR